MKRYFLLLTAVCLIKNAFQRSANYKFQKQQYRANYPPILKLNPEVCCEGQTFIQVQTIIETAGDNALDDDYERIRISEEPEEAELEDDTTEYRFRDIVTPKTLEINEEQYEITANPEGEIVFDTGFCPNLGETMKPRQGSYEFGCPLAPGDEIKVKGRFDSGDKVKRFSLKFQNGPDIERTNFSHFNYDIRFKFGNNPARYIIMNDMEAEDQGWKDTKEEKSDNFPFQTGEDFELTFLVKEDRYQVLHFGTLLNEFKFRDPLNPENSHFVWGRDGEIRCLQVMQGNTCPDVSCCFNLKK